MMARSSNESETASYGDLHTDQINTVNISSDQNDNENVWIDEDDFLAAKRR